MSSGECGRLSKTEITVTDQFNTPELKALEASIDDALVRTFGADTLDYERYKLAKDFYRGPYNYKHPARPHEFQRSIARSKDSSVPLLRQAIKSLDEQLEDCIHPTLQWSQQLQN